MRRLPRRRAAKAMPPAAAESTNYSHGLSAILSHEASPPSNSKIKRASHPVGTRDTLAVPPKFSTSLISRVGLLFVAITG
jgi:hypothetical protein